MRTKKIPLGITGMAKILILEPAEVREWKHYKTVRNLFNDYNYEVISKEKLCNKLDEISVLCVNDAEEKLAHYATAIDNAKTVIRTLY